MPAEPQSNGLSARGAARSMTPGDVPEQLRRLYHFEAHGAEWRIYRDIQAQTPLFVDRGRRLIADRADPDIVRDLTAIARHRGWRVLEASGAPEFRREAWIAGQAAGLVVAGHRPASRDLQELERRLDARDRGAPSTAPAMTGADRLQVVEALARARIDDPVVRTAVIARAQARMADWLERGARFPVLRSTRDPAPQPAPPQERRRAR
jgi:hypothetical protein